MKRNDETNLVIEVVQRVLDHVGTEPHQLESAIFDTLYAERRRLETEPDPALARSQGALYDCVQAEALHAGPIRPHAQRRAR